MSGLLGAERCDHAREENKQKSKAEFPFRLGSALFFE
jgi:hypothetical protein